MYLVALLYLKSIFLSDPLEHTQHTHPKRQSQLLAVLLTSLHSGPPLTTPINSVKVNPPNLLLHR